ncbi:MAG: diacylglycerol kinase [Deltaproteobacteria bacterium]|nr:diacylglycerol kinase [Deltaproteobacteria bacterium]
MKPERWLETLNCAVEGVLQAVRSQRHMRWHTLACLAVLVLAPRFFVTPAEFALLCLAAALVLVAELANTALEATVDLASPEFHPLARTAKDVAAGAVLVAAFAAAAVGWVVLFPRIGPGAARALGVLDQREPVALAAVALSALVLVVVAKSFFGTGSVLHGGFPSGHAAVSFALASVLTLRGRDPVIGVVTGVLALMVSHSRLLLGIHTRFEVVAGVVLGVVSGSLLYWMIF